MKKIIYSITILLFVALAASSCRKHSIYGDGSTIVQARTVTAFTAVQANADIRVYISYGNIPSVEVRGYENLVAITETNVVNNKLNIQYKKDYYNVKNSNVEVYITIPVLTEARTNGSGDININGFMIAANVLLGINGSSDIHMSNSNYTDAVFDINGSGNILASGSLIKNADATIHGSGDIETMCSQKLTVRIYGSGDVKYWGNPSLDVQVSGSGTVKKQ